ncbi:MAG: dihydrodipicolinate synthase family protein [Caldilineaceae bacterium]|nr:dihydrodipicolinate synthase family protein [Caldilineaceae bacterium]
MTLDEIRNALKTVVAIPVTPFSPDGAVDFGLYRKLVTRMVEGGIRVVTPNGNTSEFYSLTSVEHRRQLEETVVAVGEASQPALVLAGVGFDTQTAIEMTYLAQVMGAQAVMVHQPVHPYRSDDGWISYHQAIAASAPEIGIVPYVRDATISGATIRRLAERCPNFVGIKYAVGNPPLFAKIVNEVGRERLAWVCGIAESWAPFFAVAGAQGFTSGLVNLTPRLSLAMQAALEAGNYARAMDIWARVKPFEDLRARRDNANNVSAVKEAMAQLGLCERTVRPPISELPNGEREEVREILRVLEVSA